MTNKIPTADHSEIHLVLALMDKFHEANARNDKDAMRDYAFAVDRLARSYRWTFQDIIEDMAPATSYVAILRENEYFDALDKANGFD